MSGPQYPVLIWLNAEYTNLAVFMSSTQERRVYTGSNLLYQLQKKSIRFKRIAWSQCYFYYITRATYVIWQSVCYNMDNSLNDACVNRSQNLNAACTVITCLSIVIFFMADFYLIKSSLDKQVVASTQRISE